MDNQRFLSDFRALGKIHSSNDGVKREAYTKEYCEARGFAEAMMRDTGMAVRTDSVGNLFGRYGDSCERRILIGSHLDSVPHGGIYDGHLGVIAAIETARSLRDKPIEVVAFIAEEGGPMGGTFGSRALVGSVEKTMIPPAAEMEKAGLSIEKIRSAAVSSSSYSAFIELHIEQGPFLERKGINIGIPSGIVCINRHRVTLTGEANHAGTTPMDERRDAMREAAELLSYWFNWVDTQRGFVCNAGCFGIEPNVVTIVPGKAVFTLEIRSIDDEIAYGAVDKFKEFLARVECKSQIELILHKKAVSLDLNLRKHIEEACNQLEFSCTEMPSGASHDAAALAPYIPSAMIFVPSANGVSHSPAEYTPDDDIVRGAAVLERAVLNFLSA